jgi:tetratricopeptide (TPR) repeat protein
MKTKIIALLLAVVSLSAFAQKAEMKAAEKAIKKQEYATAISSIDAAESFLTSMDAKTKAKFYFIKGRAYMGKKQFQTAADAFDALEATEKQSGKKKYTEQAKPMRDQMVQEVFKQAGDQYDAKDYGNAAKNYYLVYKLSPKDTTFAYNAAISSGLNKDYDGALKYYNELLEIGYTGIQTLYFATNKETGVKENLGSKGNRDIMVKSGTYTNPVNENSKSKVGDITKNVAYILKQQGKTEEALIAIEKARKMFPQDLNLILTQADIYFEQGKTEEFGKLMEEAIQQDPNNPQLYFNLGVINADQGNAEKAMEYYKKAVEIKPDYGDDYMNLAVAILDEEKAIVDEMNQNLSDFDKYDELQAKQKDVYKRALPYLEKADEYGRSLNTVQNLMNIYATLEMTEKEQEYAALYKKMRDE